jgi:hypothetical protein
LAGYRCRFAESYPITDARAAFEELITGRLDLLVTRRPYSPGPPIPLNAVMLANATRLKVAFLDYLGRFQPSAGTLSIIDLVGGIGRHGAPSNWAVEIVESTIPNVVRDPRLDRLATMSASQIQTWAEGDYTRLELGRIARGFKPGWSEHSRRGWLDKQVKRDRTVRQKEPRRTPQSRSR